MKSITSKIILIAEKHGNTFSELMEKYSMSEDQVEDSIRKLFPPRRASNLISTFRKNDKKLQENTMKKSNKSKQSTNTSPIIPVVAEAIIVADDSVDDTVTTVGEVFEEHAKSKLEILQEKERSLTESLSEAERELEKLYGIRAEITQKVQSLTKEVRELKATIEHKVSEVGELKDYNEEVSNQIAVSELDVEAIKKELQETQEARMAEQVVIITVLADGWFKFEPETIKIPNVEVSSDELSEIFSTFILDPQFETISRKDIRQLIMLDKMIKTLENEHYDINVKFENYVLENAWMSWKAE